MYSRTGAAANAAATATGAMTGAATGGEGGADSAWGLGGAGCKHKTPATRDIHECSLSPCHKIATEANRRYVWYVRVYSYCP